MLPAKVAGEVVQEVGRNFSSFFAKRKKQADNSENFHERIKMPRYLEKHGIHTVTFPHDAFSQYPIKRKDGLWEQILCSRELNLHVVTTKRDVKMIRIQPLSVGFRIHAIYEEEPLPYEYVPDNGIYASIDFGINNLMAVFVNDARYKPFIVPGGYVKSINHWWKHCRHHAWLSLRAQYGFSNAVNMQNKQDDLELEVDTKSIRRIDLKRKHILDWQSGNITSFVVNYLASIGVSHVIIGSSSTWKQNTQLSQSTWSFPISVFIDMLEYKFKELGIRVTRTEESYTSKASFVDHDRMGVYGKHDHFTYSGRRTYRGLYRTKTGLLVNADVNGAANIMRKVIPDELVYSKGVEALAVGPVRYVKLTKQGKCAFR